MDDRVTPGAADFPAPKSGCLVVIGNFDGVHRGHQLILNQAVSQAQGEGVQPVVLTFEPHPSEVLGRKAVARLTSPERKLELLTGFDPSLRVVVQEFNAPLAKLSPRDFVREILHESLAARRVVVGQNFRFGQNRAGDGTVLAALGREFGFVAETAALATDEGGPLSSSRVRRGLALGDLVTVRRILGRPHALSGKVVHGQGRGREIGVPTANLDGVVEALPAHGVYAGLVEEVCSHGPRRLALAAVNVGVRPTVAAGFSVEAHLLDFSENLYEKKLRIHLTHRLRGERKFAGLAELKDQIRADIACVREKLGQAAERSAEPAPWF